MCLTKLFILLIGKMKLKTFFKKEIVRVERGKDDMDIKKIYKEYKKKAPGIAIKKAMDEIDSYIDNIELNENFYKEYTSLKNQIFFMDVIAPSLIYGIIASSVVSFFNYFETGIGEICRVIVFLITTLFVAGLYFHSVPRRVLYPYLLKKMEYKIETQKDVSFVPDENNKADDSLSGTPAD